MAITTGAKVPEKGKVMTDLLVSALACDLTRVGTMQWSDSEAKFMLGFLKDSSGQTLKDHHDGYQDDRGFQPEALEIIYRFYAENLAYLLQRLDSVTEGSGSVLGNTLVLAVSEIQSPPDHGQNNMPLLLAGKAGGKLMTKRWLKCNGQSHNNLLVSILNWFGIEATTFGNAKYLQRRTHGARLVTPLCGCAAIRSQTRTRTGPFKAIAFTPAEKRQRPGTRLTC